MKKILNLLVSFIIILSLQGCGDGSGNAGGGNDAGMGTSNSLPIGDLTSMGGGDMGGSMDINNLMGGLMSGEDDEDDEDDSSDSSTNNAASKYTDRGDILINFEGNDYPLKAVVGPDLTPTVYIIDDNLTEVKIQVAAYDVKEDRLNVDTGSLVFKFNIPIINDGENYYLEPGTVNLLYPSNNHGLVTIEKVRVFNKSIYITLSINSAEFIGDTGDIFIISINAEISIPPLTE